MIVEETTRTNSEYFLNSMLNGLPPVIKQEYDTETRQLTIYCTDGTVYRLQMVQIN